MCGPGTVCHLRNPLHYKGPLGDVGMSWHSFSAYKLPEKGSIGSVVIHAPQLNAIARAEFIGLNGFGQTGYDAIKILRKLAACRKPFSARNV